MGTASHDCSSGVCSIASLAIPTVIWLFFGLITLLWVFTKCWFSKFFFKNKIFSVSGSADEATEARCKRTGRLSSCRLAVSVSFSSCCAYCWMERSMRMSSKWREKKDQRKSIYSINWFRIVCINNNVNECFMGR